MNKSYLNFRTDMANERVDVYKKVNNLTEIDGVIVTSKKENDVVVTRVEVKNENGSQAIDKPVGVYVTVEFSDSRYLEEKELETIEKYIKETLNEFIEKEKKKLLVIGLGNEYITPDALGSKVIKDLDVTRALFKYARELVNENTKEVSAIAPGVLGTTGIETVDIVKSVTNIVRPDYIIAIDSLASMSMERVGKTIQMSNTGITPGSGIKNNREGLNYETLNKEVIAIGIPMVVDMAAITNEAIDKILENTKEEVNNYNDENINKRSSNVIFNLLNDENRYSTIANILNTKNYIVTPKEIDEIINKTSEILARTINGII